MLCSNDFCVFEIILKFLFGVKCQSATFNVQGLSEACGIVACTFVAQDSFFESSIQVNNENMFID